MGLDEKREERNDAGSEDQVEEVKFEPVDDTPLPPAEEASPQIQGDLQPTEEVVEPAPAEGSGDDSSSLEEVEPEEGADPVQESAGKEETSEVAIDDAPVEPKKGKTLGKSATARYQENISKQMSPAKAKKLKLSLIIAIPILILGLSALVVWKYIEMNTPRTPVVHEKAGDEELKQVLTDAEAQHLKAMQLWTEAMGWEPYASDLEKLRTYKQKADEAIALIDATVKMLNDKHKEWVEKGLRIVESGAKYEETVTAERYEKEKEEKRLGMIRDRMGRVLASLEASQGGKTPEPAPVRPPDNAAAPETPKEAPPVAEQPKKPSDMPIIESGKKVEEPVAKPENPVEPKPEEPVAKPENPVEPKPEEPVAKPENPVEPKPEEPVAKPENPVEPKPEEPIAKPENPVEPKPEEPVAKPENPVEPKPEEPVAKPENPVEPKPEEPIAKPENPVEPKPEEPVAKPENPVEPKPEEPIAQPEKPAEPKPEEPIAQPEKPAEPKPEEPVAKPENPVEPKPEEPPVAKPENPVEPKPEIAAKPAEPPAKPPVREPVITPSDIILDGAHNTVIQTSKVFVDTIQKAINPPFDASGGFDKKEVSEIIKSLEAIQGMLTKASEDYKRVREQQPDAKYAYLDENIRRITNINTFLRERIGVLRTIVKEEKVVAPEKTPEKAPEPAPAPEKKEEAKPPEGVPVKPAPGEPVEPGKDPAPVEPEKKEAAPVEPANPAPANPAEPEKPEVKPPESVPPPDAEKAVEPKAEESEPGKAEEPKAEEPKAPDAPVQPDKPAEPGQ